MTLIIQLSPLHLAHLRVQSLIFNSNNDKWQEIKMKEFTVESNRFHIHPKTLLSGQTPFFFNSGFFLKLCNSRYYADTFIYQFISFRQLTVDATIGKRESLNYELLSLLCLITTLFLLFATLYVSSNVF